MKPTLISSFSLIFLLAICSVNIQANTLITSHHEVIFKTGHENFICEAQDQCFYVAPGASDEAACTFDDPCDLIAGRDRLSGGDILYLLSGIYSETYTFTEGAFGNYEMIMAFGRNHNFENPQPAADMRIHIKPYPGHVVTIDGNYDTNSDTGAQCFYTDQSYITISGFNFLDCKIGLNVGQNRITEDVIATIVEHNTFTGTHFINDNGGNITVYGFAIDTIIQNNSFDGPGADLGSMNSAGIYYTHDRHIRILNNEISNHRTGIHYKHDHSPSAGNTGSIIAYNYIHDVSIAARLNTRYTQIHNNISSASAGDFSINHCSGATGEGGDYNFIYNNYFHSLGFNGCSDSNIDQGAYQNILINNIIVTRFYLHPWNDTPHESIMDYNLYVQDIFENNVSYDLSQWQIYYGQDTNSLTGVPTFTDPNLDTIPDYQLLPGSLGYQSDDNGNNMGPDISCVGLVSQ